MEKKFSIILLGVIFNQKTGKILIGRRENDPDVPKLTWCFPGGELVLKEDINDSLKKSIREKTGIDVKELKPVFVKTYPEKEDLFAVYFLSGIFEGEEKPGDDFVELKWVSPEEIEEHFTTSFHPKLKKYIMNLK